MATIKSREYVLDKEELQALFNACEDFYEEFAIKTLALTGLRVGEFLHLNPGWVNFEEGYIRVPRRIKCGKCGYCNQKAWEYKRRMQLYIKNPQTIERLRNEPNFLNGYWVSKTAEAQRIVPFVSNEVPRLLREFFKESYYVYEEYHDKVTVWKMCKDVGKRIGKKVTPHILRASFATRLASMGVSEANLCAIMGWSSLQTALHYVRASGRRAIEEVNRLLKVQSFV